MSFRSRVPSLTLTVSLSIATVLSATGLIYLVRQIRTGAPQIQDALPLDELSGHAQVDLLLFLAVWIAAGAALWVAVDATRISAHDALPVLTLTLFLTAYVLAAISIFVVRQIPLANGFVAALATPSIYLATLPAALPSALRAAAERKRPRPTEASRNGGS
jgi:hypothetical protein